MRRFLGSDCSLSYKLINKKARFPFSGC